MTPAQFGALLTRLHQGERKSPRKYWIGLKYLPAYIKRWEAGDPPSWWALVTMKQIADAHDIPFQLPTDAAPYRIQAELPPGEYYRPEERLLLADLPPTLPSMRSGRAYASSQKIRKYRPRKPGRNPTPMNSLTEMGLDYSYNPNRWMRIGDVLVEATETPHIVTVGYGAPYRSRSKRFDIVATFPDGAQKVLIRGAKTISGGLQRAAKMLEKV